MPRLDGFGTRHFHRLQESLLQESSRCLFQRETVVLVAGARYALEVAALDVAVVEAEGDVVCFAVAVALAFDPGVDDCLEA